MTINPEPRLAPRSPTSFVKILFDQVPAVHYLLTFLIAALLAGCGGQSPLPARETSQPGASQAPPAVHGQAHLQPTSAGFLRDGQPFSWRGITAFRLLDYIADGQEGRTVEYLQWAQLLQLTVVRVLALLDGFFDLTPEAVGQFDRVTCIGVLMILADPRTALERMWECVAPGGDLVLWVYAREGNRALLPFITVVRAVGSRLPLPVVDKMARAATSVVLPIIKIIPIQTEYYRHLRRLSRKNVQSIIFDQMIPRNAAYWSRDQLLQLLSVIPAKPHIELVQGNSWHVRIQKPLD